MYRNNRAQLPARTVPEYVIYFYESGLSKKYQQRQKNIFARFNYGPAVGYDFTSDLVAKKSGFVPQTVEDVVRNGYFSIPKSDSETAIISDKKSTSWLGLDDIINQIRNRYEVYNNNIYEIEVSKCSAINGFYQSEAWHGPSDSKLEYSINKRMDRLYQAQRDERMNLWRDISRIKLLLPEKAQEYLAAYRKVSILNDETGDPF